MSQAAEIWMHPYADPARVITADAAIAMLPEADEIHTFLFRGFAGGCDMDRIDVIEELKVSPRIALALPGTLADTFDPVRDKPRRSGRGRIARTA